MGIGYNRPSGILLQAQLESNLSHWGTAERFATAGFGMVWSCTFMHHIISNCSTPRIFSALSIGGRVGQTPTSPVAHIHLCSVFLSPSRPAPSLVVVASSLARSSPPFRRLLKPLFRALGTVPFLLISGGKVNRRWEGAT